MSSDDKQKRSDALKNLEAARRGEKKRMDQYEEYDEEFDEDYDEQAIEEYLQEKRSKKRKKKSVPASHDITKFMTSEVNADEMFNVSPPNKKKKNDRTLEEREELLNQLDGNDKKNRKNQLYGESRYNTDKEILPPPPQMLQIKWCDIPQRTENIQLKKFTVKDNNQVIKLYWFDASCEKSNVIYLFGKAETTNGKFVSCCTVIDDMMRNIYLLPKQFAENPFTRDLNKPSDEDRKLSTSLLETLADICDAQNISNYRMKFVKRRYAFEEAGVPYEETTYLKLSYPYCGTNEFKLPSNQSVFLKAFGTSQSALELFLLKKRIKGPCWLEVSSFSLSDTEKDAQYTDNLGGLHGTWCRVEVKASFNKIYVSNDQSNIPKLSVMSLKIKTFLNERAKVNEIVAISAIVHNAVVIDGPTENIESGYKNLLW